MPICVCPFPRKIVPCVISYSPAPLLMAHSRSTRGSNSPYTRRSIMDNTSRVGGIKHYTSPSTAADNTHERKPTTTFPTPADCSYRNRYVDLSHAIEVQFEIFTFRSRSNKSQILFEIIITGPAPCSASASRSFHFKFYGTPVYESSSS